MGQVCGIPVNQIADSAGNRILPANGHITGTDVMDDLPDGTAAEYLVRAVGDGGLLPQVDLRPIGEDPVGIVQLPVRNGHITVLEFKHAGSPAVEQGDAGFFVRQLQCSFFAVRIPAYELHHGAVLGPQQPPRRGMEPVLSLQCQGQCSGLCGLDADGRPQAWTLLGVRGCDIHILQRQRQVPWTVGCHRDDIDSGICGPCYHQFPVRCLLPGNGDCIRLSGPHTRDTVRSGGHSAQGDVKGHRLGKRLRCGLHRFRGSSTFFPLRRQRRAA